MIERNQTYRCGICGNIVTVLHAGGGELVCCGQPMNKLIENTVDASLEKHVPVIEKIEGGYRVKVGSVPHPMEPDHYIQWIELMADGEALRKFLNPGEDPVAEFMTKAQSVSAREYCTLHGLWKV